MTIQEFMAGNVERMGQILAFALESTRDERKDWKPVGGDSDSEAANVRSALDQISECIVVNRYFAALFRGETPPSSGSPITAPRPFSTPDEAQAQIRESAAELADAMRGLSDADMEREFTGRRGPMPGHAMLEVPYRNMAYHWGQINQIQLLYGDAEFHVPPARPEKK